MTLNGRKVNARKIVTDFKSGMSIYKLSEKYLLCEYDIQEVIRRWMKKHGIRSEQR